jgi:hypothetical protein
MLPLAWKLNEQIVTGEFKILCNYSLEIPLLCLLYYCFRVTFMSLQYFRVPFMSPSPSSESLLYFSNYCFRVPYVSVQLLFESPFYVSSTTVSKSLLCLSNCCFRFPSVSLKLLFHSPFCVSQIAVLESLLLLQLLFRSPFQDFLVTVSESMIDRTREGLSRLCVLTENIC